MRNKPNVVPPAGILRAVIFDLDGVLADSHPVHESAWKALLLENGTVVEPNFAKVIREGRTRTDLLTQFYPDLSPERMARLGDRKDELYTALVSGLRPVPGVIEFVHALSKAGFHLGVATCAGRVRTRQTLLLFGLEDVFGSVVTSADVLAGKPDPALYVLVAEKLGVTPAQSLVFEDSVSGVLAAKRAGMFCVAYSPGNEDAALRDAGADAVIMQFSSETLSLLYSAQEKA